MGDTAAHTGLPVAEEGDKVGPGQSEIPGVKGLVRFASLGHWDYDTACSGSVGVWSTVACLVTMKLGEAAGCVPLTGRRHCVQTDHCTTSEILNGFVVPLHNHGLVPGNSVALSVVLLWKRLVLLKR